MKIVFIDHYAGSERHGMAYRHYYLAKTMAEYGHEVSIIAASYSHLRYHQPEVNKSYAIEDVNGVKFIWLKTGRYTNNGLSRRKNIFAFSWSLFKPTVVIQN